MEGLRYDIYISTYYINHGGLWPRSVSRPGTDGCPTPRVHQSQPLLASSSQRLPKPHFKPRHCASPRYRRRVEACRGGPHHRVWSALLSEELSPWSRTQRSERLPFPLRTHAQSKPITQSRSSYVVAIACCKDCRLATPVFRSSTPLSTRQKNVPRKVK